MRYLIVISLLLLSSICSSSAQEISAEAYYFFSGSQTELRWNYPAEKGIDYFTVETSVDGNWQQVSENIEAKENFNTAVRQLGIKYLPFQEIVQAYSLINTRSIGPLWDMLVDSLDDLKFINLLASNNIEYAQLSGCYFIVNSSALNDQFRVYYWIGGNKSLWAEVTIDQVGKLNSVEDLRAEVDRSGADLSWSALSDNNKTITGYRLYGRVKGEDLFKIKDPFGQIAIGSAELIKAGFGNREGYLERYLSTGKTYEYYVVSTNAFGKEGPIGRIVEFRIGGEDLDEPFNFSAEQMTKAVRLSWENNDEENVTNIFRSAKREGDFTRVFPLAEPLFQGDTSWIDHDVELGANYFYYALSSDEEFNLSNTTDTIEVILTDEDAPSAPKNVRLEPKEGVMQILWDPNPEKDILGYEVERYGDVNFSIPILLNPEPIAEINYLDTITKKSEVVFGYIVYAIDNSYNKSDGSEIVKAQLPDLNPPAAPYIIDADYVKDNVSLTWYAPMDTDVVLYAVYIKNAKTGSSEKIGETNQVTWKDEINREGTFDFSVKAVDEAGNESEESNTIQYDLKPNNEIGIPSQAELVVKENGILLRWNKPINGTFFGYTILRKNLDADILTFIDEFSNETSEFLDSKASKKTNYIYFLYCHDEDYDTGKAVELNYKSE